MSTVLYSTETEGIKSFLHTCVNVQLQTFVSLHTRGLWVNGVNEYVNISGMGGYETRNTGSSSVVPKPLGVVPNKSKAIEL